MNCHTSNGHLGDCAWTLTSMSRLPGPHTLRCNPDYIPALRELVEGTDITIEDCSNVLPDSFDCWIASGRFASYGVHYRDDIDIMGFVQRYFNAMSIAAGLGVAFPTRESLLCDWPSILHRYTATMSVDRFRGILFINADPKSGQCPGYSSSEMDTLIRRLEDAGNSVCSIENANLSLVQIGALSIHAKFIIGCATGPWWPTMNIWNKDTPRIVMLSPMRLDYGSVPIQHAANAAEVATLLEGMGYL